VKRHHYEDSSTENVALMRAAGSNPGLEPNCFHTNANFPLVDAQVSLCQDISNYCIYLRAILGSESCCGWSRQSSVAPLA